MADEDYPKLITEHELTANERINLDEIKTEHGLDEVGPEALAEYVPGVKYFDLWRDEEGGSASINFPGHEFDITMGVEVINDEWPEDVYAARAEAAWATRQG